MARSAHAGDPYLRWFTVRTPHFRVHYHGGLEALAQRTATIAERAHASLVPQLGWSPTETTEIVLTDDSDSANGLASGRPYNSILLYVTAPEDMSALGDYDDWQLDLVTHEYTHILHVDNLSGLPAIVNAVFGKVSTPNQSQPRWILEGLAVAMESQHSTAGRLRNTQFDMFLRADVLEGNLASLDEISNYPRRWPGGNLWYLYGAKFIDWILEVYGPETFAEVATHYGRFVIPWGINRAIRRATSRTYPDLYVGWKRTLEERYAAMRSDIVARGLREGRRLTHHGRIAFSPRFVPKRCRTGDSDELVYYRDDGEGRTGIYSASLSAKPAADSAMWTRTTGHFTSFAPDCALLFESSAPTRRRHTFSDLFRLPHGVRSPSGLDPRRRRLTVGERARSPDVSPDGRRIVYVTNHAGTTTLRIAELDADGNLGRSERLVPSATFEQAHSPRFSPDGSSVAYSVWTQGGYRDIRIVDVESRTFRQITQDRAVDQQPAWAPDGSTLYFTSDRSGVANVYAYELASGTLRQVTNVVTGAYMPAISPDGATLVYTGYTSRGFDLFSMAIEPGRFLAAPPAPARESGAIAVPTERWPVTRYNPLPTLRPRSYSIDFGTGTFGSTIQIETQGSDAVGHHGLFAAATFSTERAEWSAVLDYAYLRLPFDLRATLFRSVAPRTYAPDFQVSRRIVEHQLGFTTGVSLWAPGEFEAQSFGFSYSVTDFSHNVPLGRSLDPWSAVPAGPDTGLLASVRLGYSYSNVESSTYAVGIERGYSLSLGIDYADQATGSEESLASFTGRAAAYFPMPWHRHHVLALALSGGASGGTYPRRGLFATGGFVDQPPFDVYTTGLQQSGFVLRGYEPSQFIGSEYALLNAEYRFPIVYVDRGVSTLPVFLQQISGSAFFDWGGAFFTLDPRDPLAVLHPSVGMELWINAVLGYRVGGTLRLGVAHGFDDEFAKDTFQTYFVAASAF